jgi:hypothetical protein
MEVCVWFVSLVSGILYAGLTLWELHTEVSREGPFWDNCYLLLAMILAPSATSSAETWWHILTYLPSRATSLFL